MKTKEKNLKLCLTTLLAWKDKIRDRKQFNHMQERGPQSDPRGWWAE